MSGIALGSAKIRRVISRLSDMILGRQPNHPKVPFSEYLYRSDEPVSPDGRHNKILVPGSKSLEDDYFMRRRVRLNVKNRLYKGAR